MQIICRESKRPYVFLTMSTDDFGTEIYAVGDFNEELPFKQIKISQDTWWHLFDLRGKLLDWEDGHNEE